MSPSVALLFLATLAACQAIPRVASQAPAPAPAGTGVVVRYFFNASMVVLAPDGFQREVITLGPGQTAGQGPTIECNSGDVISLTLVNDLPYGATIHFHGFAERGNNQYDGVPSVTQCPIPPGETFEYIVPTVGQHGTYWYHSHAYLEYVDGMKGPVVIHGTPEPQGSVYDAEYVVTLSDWYHQPSPILSNQYLSGQTQGREPVGSSVTFNGIGRYPCDVIGVLPNVTCNTPDSIPSFKFQPGKRYRLRIINTSAFTAFSFGIANHSLTIIEADGTDVVPYEVEFLTINIAQRYSVIVTANQAFGNYTMFADYICAHKYFVLRVEGRALIQYTNETLTPGTTNPAGAPSSLLPMTSAPFSTLPNTTDVTSNLTCAVLETIPLQLLNPMTLSGNGWSTANNITSLVAQSEYLSANPTINSLTFTMTFNIESNPDDIPFPVINGVNYEPQQTSVLEAIAGAPPGGALQAALALPNTTNAYVIPSSVTSVTFVLNNLDGGEHPFHLHGHMFSILGQGSGRFNATRDVPNLNFSNATLRRDTVTVPLEGWVALRFASNNPGVWFIHCHIEFHLAAGLAFMFVEHPEQLYTYANALPPSLQGACNYTQEVPALSELFNENITTLLGKS